MDGVRLLFLLLSDDVLTREEMEAIRLVGFSIAAILGAEDRKKRPALIIQWA